MLIYIIDQLLDGSFQQNFGHVFNEYANSLQNINPSSIVGCLAKIVMNKKAINISYKEKQFSENTFQPGYPEK